MPTSSRASWPPANSMMRYVRLSIQKTRSDYQQAIDRIMVESVATLHPLLPQRPPWSLSVTFSVKMLIFSIVQAQVFWLQLLGSGFHQFKPIISGYMRRSRWSSIRFLLKSLVPLALMMIVKRQSNFPHCGRRGPPFWSLCVILAE